MSTLELLTTEQATERIKRCLQLASTVLIATPFVTDAGIRLLTDEIQARRSRKLSISLLPRYDAESIVSGFCSLSALRTLIESQSDIMMIEIRRLDRIHAKFYVFDNKAIVLGSSNLTAAAQSGNIELGIYCTEKGQVGTARHEHETYWDQGVQVTSTWIDAQATALAPFSKRIRNLRQELQGLASLQSIRMQEFPGNYLKSLLAILKQARKKDGATTQWITEQLHARHRCSEESGHPLNIGKRITFLEYLGLIEKNAEILGTTEFGNRCVQDPTNRALFERMIELFPILQSCHQAIPLKGWVSYQVIAQGLGNVTAGEPEVTQALRDAVHWLAAFGLVTEEKVGVAWRMRRHNSKLEKLFKNG